MSGERECPFCDYATENGAWYCGVTCTQPECGPCGYDRWAQANPLEAAIEDARRIEDAAQRAEELAYEDWREYAAEAEAAWAEVERLEAGEVYDGQ